MLVLNEFGLNNVRIESYKKYGDQSNTIIFKLLFDKKYESHQERNLYEYFNSEFKCFYCELLENGFFEVFKEYIENEFLIHKSDINIKPQLIDFMENKFNEYINDNKVVIKKELLGIIDDKKLNELINIRKSNQSIFIKR